MLISDENKANRFEFGQSGILWAFDQKGELHTCPEYDENGDFNGHHVEVFGDWYNCETYGIYHPHLFCVFSYYILKGPEERALCRAFPEAMYKTERGVRSADRLSYA